MTTWRLVIQALRGGAMPLPAGPLPRRIVSRIVAEDMDPTEVDARELAHLLGVSRQRADQRLRHARARGDVAGLLALAIARTTTAGSAPAPINTIPAGAAAEIGQPTAP